MVALTLFVQRTHTGNAMRRRHSTARLRRYASTHRVIVRDVSSSASSALGRGRRLTLPRVPPCGRPGFQGPAVPVQAAVVGGIAPRAPCLALLIGLPSRSQTGYRSSTFASSDRLALLIVACSSAERPSVVRRAERLMTAARTSSRARAALRRRMRRASASTTGWRRTRGGATARGVGWGGCSVSPRQLERVPRHAFYAGFRRLRPHAALHAND